MELSTLTLKVFTATLGLVLGCAALARAAELRVMVKDHSGKNIEDVVVLAVPADPRSAQHSKLPLDAVDQVDKQFVPFVKPVFVGSTVRFPNSDNIRHQVYSFSPAKKFELPLYSGANAQPVMFDKPGVVVLGCNIHDWMIGYIYVAETPFFAKTGPQGTASIPDMPPGQYSVRIWHPSMDRAEEATNRQIVIGAEPLVDAAWQIELKPTFRIPRTSGAASPSYP